MAKGNHMHNGGQIVTASSLSAKKQSAWLRDHTHTSDQITGTPTTDKGRANGKQHWHDASKVS